MNPEIIREALRQVRYPGFSRDIVSFGLVKEIVCADGVTTVRLEVQTRDAKVPDQLVHDCHAVLERLPGVGRLDVKIDVKESPAPGAAGAVPGPSSIPGVKRIIAVASGKGGVGKSTVAANLAVALVAAGAKVGLCDCDLYGPSMAQMFGTRQRVTANDRDEILPVQAHGIQVMSMGFLLDDRSPVVVRGPLATRYIQQFLRQVAWRDLDYLLLDLPPGTGDIQLTVVQTVSVDGAVIVTTPQEVALIDARKAVAMFEKVNVRVLGLIENMAWFVCDAGKKYFLFGDGGGMREAVFLKVPLFGRIPFDMVTRESGDLGTPVALLAPEENTVSAAFHEMAASVLAAVPAVSGESA
jgi:ATP-binding protein involved in chromosome partitioning